MNVYTIMNTHFVYGRLLDDINHSLTSLNSFIPCNGLNLRFAAGGGISTPYSSNQLFLYPHWDLSTNLLP